MRLLLDTHAIIWYAQGSPSLSNAARDSMEREECFFSMASLWEIAIKQRLGKLGFSASIPAIATFCEAAGFHPLEIAPAHAEAVKTLPDIHRDPFDRMLVAQAQVERLTIVTTDSFIPQYPVTTVW
ncbi:MAG: type II toxin-antitoxin system VapC family toxin [Kiritimatiellae bacterium]|nr:type II toxin-antitoxin system VapC family toxin [Kiritimatiellia bacterium]